MENMLPEKMHRRHTIKFLVYLSREVITVIFRMAPSAECSGYIGVHVYRKKVVVVVLHCTAVAFLPVFATERREHRKTERRNARK